MTTTNKNFQEITPNVIKVGSVYILTEEEYEYLRKSLGILMDLLGTSKQFIQAHDALLNKMVEDQQSAEVIIPTLDQRLNDWNAEKHNTELYDLCMELPEQIVKTILNRIGTTATYEEIAEEYLRNTNYYISMQLKEAMPGITGSDAKNAKVEIRTEVERPVPEKDKPVTVPVIVKDLVK